LEVGKSQGCTVIFGKEFYKIFRYVNKVMFGEINTVLKVHEGLWYSAFPSLSPDLERLWKLATILDPSASPSLL
jgi:hypothetical protein